MAVIAAANMALLPPANAIVPAGDKLAHLLLVGGTAWLVNVSLYGRRLQVGRLRPMTGSVVVGVLIGVEEFSQLWLSARTFSWGDMAMNLIGVLLAAILAEWWLRWRLVEPITVPSDQPSSS
ncbi:MAG: hypothetical protein AAFX76_09200 [Planctomycetota bacterium]